jgi:hypothetical protein
MPMGRDGKAWCASRHWSRLRLVLPKFSLWPG